MLKGDKEAVNEAVVWLKKNIAQSKRAIILLATKDGYEAKIVGEHDINEIVGNLEILKVELINLNRHKETEQTGEK